jgi:hypothetical protein
MIYDFMYYEKEDLKFQTIIQYDQNGMMRKENQQIYVSIRSRTRSIVSNFDASARIIKNKSLPPVSSDGKQFIFKFIFLLIFDC